MHEPRSLPTVYRLTCHDCVMLSRLLYTKACRKRCITSKKELAERLRAKSRLDFAVPPAQLTARTPASVCLPPLRARRCGVLCQFSLHGTPSLHVMHRHVTPVVALGSRCSGTWQSGRTHRARKRASRRGSLFHGFGPLGTCSAGHLCALTLCRAGLGRACHVGRTPLEATP